jgi:hypothetical protein
MVVFQPDDPVTDIIMIFSTKGKRIELFPQLDKKPMALALGLLT